MGLWGLTRPGGGRQREIQGVALAPQARVGYSIVKEPWSGLPLPYFSSKEYERRARVEGHGMRIALIVG